MKRPGFVEKCELWRTRESDGNILGDIYMMVKFGENFPAHPDIHF